MTDVTSLLKVCIGKPLKALREDPKQGTLTLEFEDSSLNTKVTFYMKPNSFVGSSTTAVKKPKSSLKAKEQALEPVTQVKPPKKRKRPTRSNLAEM